MGNLKVLILLIFVLLNCPKQNGNKIETKLKDAIKKKELSSSQIKIYRACLNSIRNSEIIKKEGIDGQVKLRVEKEFGSSSIINFKRKLKGKIGDPKKLDEKVNNQNYESPELEFKTLSDSIEPKFIIALSKPDANYITAFAHEIFWIKNDQVAFNENIQHNFLFLISKDTISEIYSDTAIFESY